jgi:nucleoside-diphosphate-sugar epimerase
MSVAFVTGGSGYLGRNLIGHLVRDGYEVRALARSPSSRAAVESRGAVAVEGDLDGGESVVSAMTACDVVIHCAAAADDWGSKAAMWKANVDGTEAMLSCAKRAGASRFVHVSTEAVLVDGDPLVRVDETRPLPAKPIGLYAITKGEAERRVHAAARDGMDAMIVRPRFIWGNDDTTLLPRFIEEHESGRFVWFGDGMNLTSTTHVDNACRGLLCAAKNGKRGETYFVTDGAPSPFRTMIESMFRASGIEPTKRSVPRPLAHAVAVAGDALARGLGLGRPPLPHLTYHLLADEVTVVDDKARREIGYANVISREEGLTRLTRR